MAGQVRYIRIHCEEQRRRELAPRGQRGGHALVRPSTGVTYACLLDGEWFCCCCKKPIRVVT